MKIGFEVLLNLSSICPGNNERLIKFSTWLSVWA